jgi:hypothetical protein
MISNCPIPRPLLGLIGAILLGGSVLTPAAWTQDLIWENQGLTDEQGITSGSTFAYNGATLTVTWTL